MAVSNMGAADLAISANTTGGALRFSGTTVRAITFTAGTEVLNLALGGLLRSNEAGGLNVGTTTLRGVLTSGGTATTGTTDLVVYNNTATTTINSVIANNGAGNLTRLVKSGGSALTLTAQNTYTGGTVVNQSTLNLSGTTNGFVVIPTGGLTINNATVTMNTNGGQIDASNIVTLNGSSVLTLVGSNTLNSLNFNNTGGNATPTVATGTQLTLSSATPITAVNDNYSFTPTISGTLLTLQDGAAISTSGLSPINSIMSAPISTVAATSPLVKTGAGSLVLSSAASNFANGFNLNQGSLIFANNSVGTPPAVTAGPIGTGTLTLANGVAVMSDGTARTIGNAVSVTQDFTFGTLATDGSRANAGNNLTLSGVVTLASGAHTINVGGLLMTGTISGQLTGGTDLTKSGPGTFVLQNATNNYGGTTTVSAGTLQLGSAGAIPDGSALIVNNGGFFNLNAFSETVGSLAGAGVITNTGAAATLTTGSDATSTTFSGVITNQTNALGVTKIGTGTQTLAGANSYTGATVVTGGILSISNALGLGTAAQGTTVSAGASLELQNNITVTGETLGIAGTGVGGTGALRNLSGSNTHAGAITLTAAATITADAGLLTLDVVSGNAITSVNHAVTIGGAGDLAVADAIALGTGGLTKVGAGTLILSAVNNYDGATIVEGGKLTFTTTGSIKDTSAVNLTGATAVVDIATITAAGETVGSLAGVSGSSVLLGDKTLSVGSDNTSTTMAGVISGTAGAITKQGTGTMTLNAANTYTGATNVDAGMLMINGDQSAATGAVTVASGATLGGSGTIGGIASTATIASGGTLTGGNDGSSMTVGVLDPLVTDAVGTLSFGGDLTAATGSIWLVDLVQGVSGTSDLINVGGALGIGGANLAINFGGAFLEHQVFTIATYGTGLTGTFSNLNEGAFVDPGSLYRISYGTGIGSGAITLTAVPEPGTLGFLGLALAGFLTRRIRKRRAAVAQIARASQE
jgi:autotransporter-associated beta strand protein